MYNVHLKQNSLTKTSPNENRGKHINGKINESTKANVYNHISSYPTIQSHYCRSDSKKLYLGPHLSVNKMYDLYKNQCITNQDSRVKLRYYRQIFNNNFNLDFFSPKKDICDVCFEIESMTKHGSLDDEIIKNHESHVLKKDEMRLERENDKIVNSKIAIVCFDLENVIKLPKTNVGSAFYKRKLNVYNLTAHINLTRKIYCAVWNETIVGRSGNDIVSAVICCLKQIIEDHDSVQEIITWSDSCVPQNRNSLISTAMLCFL